MRATSFSPCGDDSGFVLDEMLCAVILRSANHPSSAAIDRRDKAASRLENLSVAADCVRTVDEIEDRVNAVRVSRAQRVNHVDGFGVVDFFGAEAASFVGVAANRRDDVRAAGARHLHRVAADPAGRAHHNEALARGNAQKLERPERSYRRQWAARLPVRQ